MRRPLLCGCVCLFVIIALYTQLMSPPSQDTDNTDWEGDIVSLIGQVYQKEYRVSYGEERIILYLDSVLYSEEEATSSVEIQNNSKKLSEINPLSKIICEIKMSDVPEEGRIPALGSKIIVRGEWKGFEAATNPGEFDWARYYAIEGISAKLQNAEIIATGERKWEIREGLFQMRQHLLQNLYAAFPQQEAAILAKMLLGDGSGLDPEIKDLYQSNGIVHILSISGLHITMLGMGLYIGLRKCYVPIVPAAIMGGLVIFLYGVMTGFGISACRAVGMYLIRMLGEIWGKSYDMLTAMGLLAVIMLCSNPYWLYHSGFLLSFASVCGVGLLAPLLQFPQEWFRKKPGESKVIFMGKTLLQKSSSGFEVSLAVTLFTLPLQFYFFYKVPIYSVFINLLIVPCMSVVMVIGLVVMAFPGLSFLCPIEVGIFYWFEWLCTTFEKLPGHTMVVGKPAVWRVLLYYMLLVIILVFGKKIKRHVSLLLIATLVLFMVLRLPGKTQIHILDVGQGDCICVQTANNKCFLFDGGSSSQRNVGEKILLPFLQSQGIRKVDGVFLSHGDEDHTNGVVQLLEGELIPIEKIYLPDISSQSKHDFAELQRVVKNVEIQYIKRGERWQTGDFSIMCLHPYKGYEAESNAYSACFLLEEGEFSMLLTGDVEGEGELFLLQELKQRNITQVDVLKVAHHGSRYSTTEDFLAQLKPEISVISCGRNSVYGHPHVETLERLSESGSEILTTPECGAIMVEAGEGVKVYGFAR